MRLRTTSVSSSRRKQFFCLISRTILSKDSLAIFSKCSVRLGGGPSLTASRIERRSCSFSWFDRHGRACSRTGFRMAWYGDEIFSRQIFRILLPLLISFSRLAPVSFRALSDCSGCRAFVPGQLSPSPSVLYLTSIPMRPLCSLPSFGCAPNLQLPALLAFPFI